MNMRKTSRSNSAKQYPTYLDFEVTVNSIKGAYYARAYSVVGEASEVLPISDNALERLQKLHKTLLFPGGKHRMTRSLLNKKVKIFGLRLFDILFVGEIRNCYYQSRVRARSETKGVRLRLNFQAPELAVLPWEFIFDPNENDHVSLSYNTPIVRYLDVLKPGGSLSINPPLQILGMVVSPSDLRPLDIRREQQRINQALKNLQSRGLVNLTWLSGQTTRHLQQIMRSNDWHVFHFIGHGGFDPEMNEGTIALCHEQDGDAQFLSATQLARLLGDHKSIRLVLLNVCEGAKSSRHELFSSTASMLVKRGLPAALAMQTEITDRAAIEFSRTFYEALADGYPVDAAVGEARKQMSMASTVEWGIPVLTMRAPDGILFDIRTRNDEEAQIQKVADTFTLTSPITMEFIRVPAGKLLMGSDKAKDQSANACELPQHQVYVSQFYLGKTSVTNQQYANFVRSTGHRPPTHWQKGHIPIGKEQHPVTHVSWEDAMGFCKWLSRLTGDRYRLPTEAEWEKAARGTDGRIFPWGNQWDYTKLNCREGGVNTTTQIGTYFQSGDSPYGHEDLCGNIWEWCMDGYDPREYQRRADAQVKDPLSSGKKRKYAARGGAWFLTENLMRAAHRSSFAPDITFDGLGFRCVQVIPS